MEKIDIVICLKRRKKTKEYKKNYRKQEKPQYNNK